MKKKFLLKLIELTFGYLPVFSKQLIDRLDNVEDINTYTKSVEDMTIIYECEEDVAVRYHRITITQCDDVYIMNLTIEQPTEDVPSIYGEGCTIQSISF